jgi:hypothetical protein
MNREVHWWWGIFLISWVTISYSKKNCCLDIDIWNLKFFKVWAHRKRTVCTSVLQGLASYWVVNDVYYENFTKVVTTLCEHNGVCLNIQTVVMSTYHCAWKVNQVFYFMCIIMLGWKLTTNDPWRCVTFWQVCLILEYTFNFKYAHFPPPDFYPDFSKNELFLWTSVRCDQNFSCTFFLWR